MDKGELQREKVGEAWDALKTVLAAWAALQLLNTALNAWRKR